MKSTFKYIIGITCSLAAVFSCARIEEQDLPEASKVQKVQMTFSAVVADGDQTKTVLGGQMGDQYRKVMWQYGDTVGVCRADWYSDQMSKFTNVEEGESETATFIGQVETASSYYAFYPLSASPRYNYDWNLITFNWPAAQTYAPASFGRDAMPMISKANSGEVYQFNSLAGVFAVNLTGTETIKSVSFTGYDANGIPMPVAGTFSVNMGYTDPQLVAEGHNISTVTLNCKDGVNLDSSTPTPFYIVLPPATYNSFTISVATTDGKVMLKRASNPLTIRSANVTKAGSLVFVADEAYDLSEFSTANSYVITDPGIFSFDATTIGNGGYGFVEGARFHTESPFIRPVSAELLWEDRMGVVSNVTFDGSNIVFLTSDIEGNALIAVKDEAGKILWSWHIWRTDQPEEHTYVNEQGNTYVMMDRALGSISAVEGDIGGALYYQWGRKDPFRLNDPLSLTDLSLHSGHPVVSMFSDLSRAVQRPTTFATGQDWVMDINASLWSNNMKTIYDPCPAGWRVPVREVWNGIRVKHNRDGGPYGVVLQFNEGDYFWYPDTPRIGSGSNTEHSYASDRTELWTSDFGITRYITYNTNNENTRDRADGHPVRCMKDENYETSLLPMVRVLAINDIHSEGATIQAAVIAEGVAPVTERGIIWGTTSELNYDSPNRQVVEGGLGEYSYTLTGLEVATKYYVRAYAINDYDISYSDVKSFNTPHDGNVFDLSLDGIANCYIVSPTYGEYAFNATVKGNSEESVGEIYDAVLLWESNMTGYMLPVNEGTQAGEIIADVTLKDGRVHFTLPFDPKPGNALIAVRNEGGQILWSWHIWVTDMDLEKSPSKLNSGAVIMDRNLGALSIASGAVDSFGLYYQWGRKDPFPVSNYFYTAPSDAITTEYDSGASIEYAVSNPTVVLDNVNWNYDQTLWGEEKTMYDPCPAGWKVPMKAAFYDKQGYFEDGRCRFNLTSATPTAYFPFAGFNDSGYNHNSGFESSYIWMVDYRTDISMSVWDGISEEETAVDFLMSVRCMKDVKSPVVGDGNDLVVDDKYEW